MQSKSAFQVYYEEEFISPSSGFQKTVKTNQGKPKRVDESKTKERNNYNQQRMLKRQEEA
jgi:hypothetical protein